MSSHGWRRTASARTAAVSTIAVVVGLAISGTASAHADTSAAARTSAASRAHVPKVTGNQQVDRLLGRMTLDEKLTLLHGEAVASAPGAANQNQAGYLPGIPRLGIPSLTLTDGPPGVMNRNDSTGMVSTMGVAATFSKQRAQAEGRTIGRDADALGQDVVLEPFINMDRDTTGGRDWNTFGEDPLLTGQLGAAQIDGIQSTGTMAQAKHFIAYDGANNVKVDQQALHEIYLQPFADAVGAGVSSIMCSYNAINASDHSSCENQETLTHVLRDELGFKGFVTSDWGGTHATTDLQAGLDMEMPGGDGSSGLASYFTKAKLHAALADGSITIGAVNQAVGRILNEYNKFGLLKHAPKHTVTPENRAADNAEVQQTADQSATLLKNDGNALPLNTDQSVAVVGPGGGQTIATFGGGEKSSGIVPEQQVGPYDVLHQRYGDKVDYSVGDDLTGTPIPASALSHDGQPGLTRTTGDKTTVDSQLWFTKDHGNALPAGSSNAWSGTITAPEDGTYWVNVGLLGTGADVKVDGTEITKSTGPFGGNGISARYGRLHANEGNGPLPATDDVANFRYQVKLTKGAHSLSVAQTPDASGDPVQLRLSWVTPSQQQANHDAAVAAAKNAKTAVVFAWANEDGDLSTPLPDGQDQLIKDIAAVNPNTVVVLNNDQPIAMPWLGNVKAVLDMYYPGDRGGYSTADVLTGKVNPGGHLPFTWPVSIDQEVAHQADHPERSSAGVGAPCENSFTEPWSCPLTTYSEGINIGYRFFDATGETPLFPFGYGLSYTKFDYSDLKVTKADDHGLNVSVRVTNSGNRTGDAVPQVYLGTPENAPSGVQFAKTALAGFDRVTVRAGHSKTVRIHVEPRQLQYWSTNLDRWQWATGKRALTVNDSSRSVALTTNISVAR